jgi:hypothetical protein
MSRRSWLALAVVLASAAPAVAQPDAKSECDYLEISASSGKDAAIDGDLKPLEKKLKKPPFSSWNVFHTLASGHVSLGKLKSEALKMKSGQATLLLRDRTDKRLELTIQIDDAAGKRVIDNKQATNAGEWLLFGQNVGDNGHILALTCK